MSADTEYVVQFEDRDQHARLYGDIIFSEAWRSLNESAVRVYIILAFHATPGTGRGWKISASRISSESGLGKSTVWKAIAKLREYGFVRIQTGPDCNRYILSRLGRVPSPNLDNTLSPNLDIKQTSNKQEQKSSTKGPNLSSSLDAEILSDWQIVVNAWHDYKGRVTKIFQKKGGGKKIDAIVRDYGSEDVILVICWLTSTHSRARFLREKGFDRISTIFARANFESYLEMAKEQGNQDLKFDGLNAQDAWDYATDWARQIIEEGEIPSKRVITIFQAVTDPMTLRMAHQDEFDIIKDRFYTAWSTQ